MFLAGATIERKTMKLKPDEKIVKEIPLTDNDARVLRMSVSLRKRLGDMIIDIYEELELREDAMWDRAAKEFGCANYAAFLNDCSESGDTMRMVADRGAMKVVLIERKD